MSDLVARAIGWVIILTGFVTALTVLGIDMVPALMILIVVGVVFIFVGKGLLANFSAGLVIQGTPMFFVGDQVTTAAGTGTVTFVTGRTVVIRTEDGREVHIPNSIITNDPVINLTHLGSRRTSLRVGVAYGTDLGEAKQLIEAAVRGCETTLVDPSPEALVSAFGDSGVLFEVHFWHDPTIVGGLRGVDAAARAIAEAFAEHGVVIPFPQRVLHIEGRGPNSTEDLRGS